MRTKLIIIFPDYTKSFKKTFNSKHRAKLKAKDTETRKPKTQKDENLVLPKQQVENPG